MKKNILLFLLLSILFLSFSLVGTPPAIYASEKALETVTPGQINEHQANENTGYTWFSYLPLSVSADDITNILVVNSAGQSACDQTDANAHVLDHMNYYLQFAEQYGYILLYPSMYRNCVLVWDDWILHFPDYVFTDSPEAKYYRPDLKVNAMIDELTASIKQQGIDVADTILTLGYSIGGHFSNRYTLLQPERVRAYAAGGLSGSQTMPVKSINDYPFNWYMAVNDYQELTGKEFNDSHFNQIPRYIFWGADDYEHFGPPDMCADYTDWNLAWCEWVEIFGDTKPEESRNQCLFAQSLGSHVECVEYPGGHEFTYDMHIDIFTFFQQFRAFSDIPSDYWAHDSIQQIDFAGITSGCATIPSRLYCPGASVTRAQMAIFLERGIHGSTYSPSGASGIFRDVPASHWAASWIEQLYADGITSGCGGGDYCPSNSVTRAQMAVFLLRSMHGASYSPPAASGIFDDVPTSYWAASWIEQLYNEGITSGCGGGNFCPNASVTRAQMAVFLARAFDLH